MEFYQSSSFKVDYVPFLQGYFEMYTVMLKVVSEALSIVRIGKTSQALRIISAMNDLPPIFPSKYLHDGPFNIQYLSFTFTFLGSFSGQLVEFCLLSCTDLQTGAGLQSDSQWRTE